MNNLNSIIIEGNLTADPDLKVINSGTAVGNFTIGTNRYYKDSTGERREEASFFNIEVWGRLAETCEEYLKKGRGVRVVGRLKQDRWTNEDGEKRNRIKIVGEHVEFKPQKKIQETPTLQAEVEEYYNAVEPF